MKQRILCALIGVLSSTLVSAKEVQNNADETGYWDRFKVNTLGLEQGAKPFYFRAGYSALIADSSSSEVVLSEVGGAASLALNNGAVAGSGASVEPVDFASVIVGWRLPWLGDAWSLETILALPLTVEFKATGTLANQSLAPYALGNIPTGVPPLGESFGETKVLPPVVTLVHRFNMENSWRPYLGAGFAYMFSYDAQVTNPVLTELGQPSLEIDDAFGIAAQAGIEVNFLKQWWINADVKYIAGLEPTATLSNIWVTTPALPTYEVARVGNASIDVAVDPWIYHIGIGFDF